MSKVDKKYLEIVLNNYNLQELLIFYDDENGAFQSVINDINRISGAPKHRRMQNNKSNRKRIAYYAKKLIYQRELQDADEIGAIVDVASEHVSSHKNETFTCMSQGNRSEEIPTNTIQYTEFMEDHQYCSQYAESTKKKWASKAIRY